MTLNKKERELMKVVFQAAEASGKCVIAPVELLARIPYDVRFLESDLAPTLEALAVEGYFSCENATYKGEPVYCITLKDKGQTFKRDREKARRTVIKSLILAAAGALVAALVKIIISAIAG